MFQETAKEGFTAAANPSFYEVRNIGKLCPSVDYDEKPLHPGTDTESVRFLTKQK